MYFAQHQIDIRDTHMPELTQNIVIVTRTLENETFLSEVVLDPGLCYYCDDPDRAGTNALALARRWLKENAAGSIPFLFLPETPESSLVHVDLEPPKPSPAWNRPVRLNFFVLTWRHESIPKSVEIQSGPHCITPPSLTIRSSVLA